MDGESRGAVCSGIGVSRAWTTMSSTLRSTLRTARTKGAGASRIRKMPSVCLVVFDSKAIGLDPVIQVTWLIYATLSGCP